MTQIIRYRTSKIFALATLLAMSFPSLGLTTSVIVSWNEIEFADKYKLLEKKPDSSVFEEVFLDSSLTTTLENRAKGTYSYRLYSCINDLSQTPIELLCEEVSEVYEKEVEIGKNLERRVIFIHSDLLGSPAAETAETTDTQENVQ